MSRTEDDTVPAAAPAEAAAEVAAASDELKVDVALVKWLQERITIPGYQG